MGIFQGFLHPALLWGTALAAVPVLIHILNRRRHRRLAWGAMRFVLAAYKKTRRRVQLENWLLLFLRTAAVLLLALALARPFLGKSSPLAPLTEKRRALVLVLDGSASTGYREFESVHTAILARARTLLSELDGTRGDRVHLLEAAAAVRPLSERAPDDALAALATLAQPRDEALDLAALLDELVDLAEEDAGESGQCSLEMRLLTDLQRATFAPAPADAGTQSTRLPAALDRLGELGVTLFVEDLGGGLPRPPNCGIEALAPLSSMLGAGATTEVAVNVQNHGATGRAGVRVALSVDGVRQPSREIDVPARASAAAVFALTLGTPGYHVLSAELEGDRLALDDRRDSVVYVPPPLRVLLVNGDPRDDIALDEVGILRAVLEPPRDDAPAGAPAGAFTPFQCEEVSTAALATLAPELARFDVLVAANVASFPADLVEALEPWVARGGALLVTLGDRSSEPAALEALNARLWRADESGLLPARLVRAVAVPDRYASYFRAATFDSTHPALAFFGDERWRPYLSELPIYAFVASEPLAAAHVLARLDDEESSPLLVERAYERGSVLLWTTSIDGDWNVFPQSPATLIPLLHELLRHAGRVSRPARDVAVGGALELELEAFPRAAELVRPDGSRTPLSGEASEVARGLWRLPPTGPLDRAGLWHVETEGGPALAVASLFDPREGDLERLGGDELEAQHPVWRLTRGTDSAGAGGDDALERGELWRPLAAAALLFLLLETLWSAWIARARRQA
jgi:hypothetical protein